MRQLSSEQLLANASAKGIKFRKGDKPLFKKHDYFQVINGYKWLFVKGVEDLIKIIENIDNKGKYKRSLHSLENKYISYISEIHKYIRQIRVKRDESKYAIFPRTKRYSDYTNINTFFLQNL